MTDRELLEMAAKAAGLDVNLELNGTYSLWNEEFDCIQSVWNPLTDDGDALRLAVKLLIAIDPCDTWCIGASATIVLNGDSVDICEPQDGGDLCTATRRAIVRAAACIGESMK